MTAQIEVPDYSKPFVFFRKPGETTIHYWKNNTKAEQLSLLNILKSGKEQFVVAPFLSFKDNLLYRFSADFMLEFNEPESLAQHIYVDASVFTSNAEIADTYPAEFKSWVENAVTDMKNGKFHKTALSKIRNKQLPSNYNWMDWFGKACVQFPKALVFIVHIPNLYTWAGATPELLLSSINNTVKTVSLAGTLHPDSSGNWSSKEREEQSFVTEYIRNVFVQSGISDVRVSVPETIQIGKLSHLKTCFEGLYNQDMHKLAQLVNLLHPTPAVGGMPKKEGIEAIQENELHDRLWYSGFLGTVSSAADVDFYVNLRSMMLGKNQALLYAGAGITAESNPDAEWLETENKLRMNLDLLD